VLLLAQHIQFYISLYKVQQNVFKHAHHLIMVFNRQQNVSLGVQFLIILMTILVCVLVARQAVWAVIQLVAFPVIKTTLMSTVQKHAIDTVMQLIFIFSKINAITSVQTEAIWLQILLHVVHAQPNVQHALWVLVIAQNVHRSSIIRVNVLMHAQSTTL